MSVMLGIRKRKPPSMVAPPKKKRKQTPAIEEITFNNEERQDYLSGFHKRKVVRSRKAKEEGAKREREEKLAARKVLREGRKADLERHVEAVNSMLRGAEEEISDASDQKEDRSQEGLQVEVEPVGGEEEYMDDDKLTTVTVEAVDISRDGLKKVIDDEDDDEDESVTKKHADDSPKGRTRTLNANGKRIWTKEKPKGPKIKKKKKTFKYENKAERKQTRVKERSGGRKQAKERKSKQ